MSESVANDHFWNGGCRLRKSVEQEIKFVFPHLAVLPVVQWLKHTCWPDKEFPRNIVSSIYYDTRDWQFLKDKINSDYLKTKMRVRWYSDIFGNHTPGAPFIEVKQKTGSGREKFRIEAPYSGKWLSQVALENPELLNIPVLLKSHGVLLQYTMYPAFIIQYERYRFVDPIHHIRVSVDHQISVPKVNHSMLYSSGSVNHVPSRLKTAVLEIKGKVDSLPGFLHYINAVGGKKSSFSKYLACYQHITHFQL